LRLIILKKDDAKLLCRGGGRGSQKENPKRKDPLNFISLVIPQTFWRGRLVRIEKLSERKRYISFSRKGEGERGPNRLCMTGGGGGAYFLGYWEVEAFQNHHPKGERKSKVVLF